MEKVWLITGVSTGLGAALAKAIINNGDKVAATFRKEQQAQQFESENPGALGLLMDVTDWPQVDRGVQKTLDHFGRIDVLVNNAGFGTVGAIEEFSMEEIRRQMETNFFGAMYLTKKTDTGAARAGWWSHFAGVVAGRFSGGAGFWFVQCQQVCAGRL